MFNLFNNKKDAQNDNESFVSIASLLIHSAKIDENFTNNENKIIKAALIKMGADVNNIEKILEEAKIKEKDSNQILDFTREIKNINQKKKELIIEILWSIIYSDKIADMYETNLMRRLSGLLYLDPKVVGDIKEKVRKKFE
tara:strand:+ start:440 stop:862 length:423 start_codon:yes stop_codon:yes gene_type:complete